MTRLFLNDSKALDHHWLNAFLEQRRSRNAYCHLTTSTVNESTINYAISKDLRKQLT